MCPIIKGIQVHIIPGINKPTAPRPTISQVLIRREVPQIPLTTTVILILIITGEINPADRNPELKGFSEKLQDFLHGKTVPVTA